MAGIGLGVLYKYIYGYGDTLGFDADTIKLVTHIKAHPSDYLRILFLSKSEYSQFITDYYPRFSGTYLLLKIFTFLYLLTNNSYWISSIYCSFFSFLGMWSLANILVKTFPKTEWEATIAFLSFPSVIFWSSGLMKESIVEGSLGFVLAIVLGKFRNHIQLKWFHFVLAPILFYWIFKIKFYYFVVLIPVLVIGIFWSKTEHIKWQIKLAIATAFLILTGFVFSKSNKLLNPDKVTKVMIMNHNDNYGFCFERASGGNLNGKGIIMFQHFNNSIASFSYNLPNAWISSIFRPLPTEAGNAFQLIISFGNLFIFCLSLICIQKLMLAKTNWKIEAIMAIAFASFLGICMAFTSPNMGTLARYKVGYMPFVIYLVLTYSGVLKYISLKKYFPQRLQIYFNKKRDSN